MKHILKKNGFTECGVIYLENGDPRDAYTCNVLIGKVSQVP